MEQIECSQLFSSAAFHFLAKPSDLEGQVAELLELRRKHGITARPLLVWEPAPPFCKATNREDHINVCQLVDTFSPNHLELTYLFEDDQVIKPFDPSQLVSYAQRFLDAGVGVSGQGSVVIRAREHGCLIMSRSVEPNWLPPFYSPTSPEVVDPTGAGNAFLGGFTAALVRSTSLTEAAMLGSVSASFVCPGTIRATNAG